MKKILPLCGSLLFFLSDSKAQSMTTVGQNPGIGFTVGGRIIELSKIPAGNVNVLLLSVKDSSVVKAAISDKTGNYKLHNIKQGSYLLSLTKPGFKKYFTSLSVSSDTVFPELIIEEQPKELQGVTVIGKKPLIEQGDDKITYNTESDPLAASETALDILRKTPFVTVDGDGNIQVNGQSSFKVLLNGRETSMFARNVKDALRSFPGSLIKKIEIITNPSAKYDAEGVAGLINIITQKKVAGYNGGLNIVTATVGGFRNNSGSINLKYGKFGLSGFLGYGGNFRQENRTFDEMQSLQPIAFFKRISEGSELKKSYFIYGNVELSYELDSLNTFSAYFSPGGGGSNSDGASLFSIVLPSIKDTVKSLFNSISDYSAPSLNTGVDYIRKFKNQPEKEVSIKLNGDFGKDNTYTNSVQDSPGIDRFIINDVKAINRQYTIQTDFIQPLGKTQKLELGAKIIIRKANSDYKSVVKYNAAEEYKVNQNNTDYFSYCQNVSSMYSTYNFKIKNISFRVGARMEHTELSGAFTTATSKVSQAYTNVLPNVLISSRSPKGSVVSLGYSMRLSRPFIWNLNPFQNNNDSLRVSKGNPDLQPQTFHTISLQWRFSSGLTFINLSLSNSFSNNQIIQYSLFNDATGITTTVPLNIGISNQTSLSGNINARFNPKFNVNINGRVSYDRIHRFTSGLPREIHSGLSGNAFLNSSYTLSSKLSASAYFGFSRQAVTLQGRYGLNYYYGTGIVYKIFQEKLTVNLSFVNFHQRDFTFRNEFSDLNFKRLSQVSYPYRGLQVSINYRFGKLSEFVSKKRGVNNDDLLAK